MLLKMLLIKYLRTGSANNGGTDGQEFTFPSGSANAGDYIYVKFKFFRGGWFYKFLRLRPEL